MQDDDLLDYDGLARMTGLKRGTLGAMVHRGTIPHIRIAPRTVRFSAAAIREWIEARKVPALPTGGGR
jgi:excisionase family DNA binding protein